MSKKKKLTGYRLHKERILFSGGEIIRTIKYPLVPFAPTQEAKQFLKRFEDAVIADDLRIRGDLNLNDYIGYTAAGKTIYTLLDFWVDCLRAGVIWMSKPTELMDFLNSRYHLASPFDVIWKNASSRITSFFEKGKFKDILQSDPVRSTSTKNSFYKRIVKYLKKEFWVESGNTVEVISPEAKREVDLIVNTFFDDNGDIVLDGEKQYQFWKKEYNLDKSIVELAKPQGEYTDITFVIIPELIADFNTDETLEDLIKRRGKWLGDDKLLQSILGLSNNFNGFSNFFGKVTQGLQEEDIENLYEAQKSLLPTLEGKKEEILKSLKFLSEKAKILERPSLPTLKGWHEYRSVFGGKLQSWFTNSQKRKLELDGQIARLKESLSKAQKYLQNQQFSGDAEKEKEEILELLSLLEGFFADDSKSIKTEENYQVFDSLLSLVKRRLNFFYQAYIQKEGDETKVNKFDAFKGLYTKIDKPVAFYGESKRKANEKFVNQTIPILEDGIANIEKLISYLRSSFSPRDTFESVKKDKETPEDSYRKFLQFFWNKYKDEAINSSVFRKKYEGVLQEDLNENDWKELKNKSRRNRYVFYKSLYAKGALQEVKIRDGDYSEKIEKKIISLTDFLSSFKKNDLLKDGMLLLDWIELSKNIVSLLLRFNTKDSYEIEGLLLSNFSQAKRYIELFGKREYSKNEFGFVVQSLILSELRGAATLYSKKEYIARYSVQVINSDSKFKLYYIPRDPRVDLKKFNQRKQLMRPHLYTIALGNISMKKNDNSNSILLDKEKITPTFLSDNDLDKLSRLSSSPYQLQFLDKYLYRPKGWEDIDITLSEWGFVVERRYRIDWDLETKKPRLLSIADEKEKKKNKLYVAIPFNLIPTKTAKKLAPLKEVAKGGEKQEKDLSRLNYPILGIDVGEYGLAYCLVKIDYDVNNYQVLDIKIIKDKNGKPVCGFIEDKNIANIKDKFAEIQQRAKEGAFDEEDTTVALVRENAIGALRNKVHAVITQRASSVIYEDSITNFETGSGRTTKIYNSVKRADTEYETDADKQTHTLVWGKGSKWVGRNVSAYASSYTCINCLSSLYRIRKEDMGKIEIFDKDGRIVTMRSPYGYVKGYISGKEKYQVGHQFKDTDNDLKAFRKIVRDFSRPPVGRNGEVLEKYAKDTLEGGKLEEFRRRRGNSAIFVCPFCQFVADADIQAAFMMALRGYLRFSGIVPPQDKSVIKIKKTKENTSGESFLEKTINYLESINRDKIIQALSLKI